MIPHSLSYQPHRLPSSEYHMPTTFIISSQMVRSRHFMIFKMFCFVCLIFQSSIYFSRLSCGHNWMKNFTFSPPYWNQEIFFIMTSFFYPHFNYLLSSNSGNPSIHYLILSLMIFQFLSFSIPFLMVQHYSHQSLLSPWPPTTLVLPIPNCDSNHQLDQIT